MIKSFEEFHTLRKRQRAMEQIGSKHGPKSREEPFGQSKKTDSKHGESKVAETTRSSKFYPRPKLLSVKTVGQMMELYDVQLLSIILIYLDLIACTLYIVLTKSSTSCQSPTPNANAPPNVEMGTSSLSGALWLLYSFTNFTLICSTIELSTLMLAFGKRFFLHNGYFLDVCIVLCCLVGEIMGVSKEIRLLSFFRVWRIARYINTTLDYANALHDKTKQLLKQEKQIRENTKLELDRCEQTLNLELESKKYVERMLKGYKDEVETLGEALKIAAYDIATAGSPTSDETDSEEELRGIMFVDNEGDAFFDGDNAVGTVNTDAPVVDNDVSVDQS